MRRYCFMGKDDHLIDGLILELLQLEKEQAIASQKVSRKQWEIAETYKTHVTNNNVNFEGSLAKDFIFMVDGQLYQLSFAYDGRFKSMNKLDAEYLML